ncbi:hypothetical protein [Brevundimonas sp. TWP2-3-4b1]|uniref:hypothetical protein n=1 Tax=Brevundimonas sp. TWP2-3-4b1 TaxID=2804580 RepID=UPI003CFB4C99
MTDQTRGGHEAPLGAVSSNVAKPNTFAERVKETAKTEHVSDELAMAVELAEIAAEELECASEEIGEPALRQAAAIRLILSRLASQEETIRADGECLAWYGERARLARLIHGEGDFGRHALAADGGQKARARLAARQEGATQ